MSEAQRRYLRKMYAKRRDEETGCDCPGCEKCTGFVRNCACDHDLEWLRLRHGTRESVEGTEDLESGLERRGVGTRSDPRATEEDFPF